MNEKLKKLLDENKQYPFMKDMAACIEELEHENERFRESYDILLNITGKYVNVLEATGKIFSLVKSYIQKHRISCPESIYQMDKPQVDAIDLACELCEIVGFIEEDEE